MQCEMLQQIVLHMWQQAMQGTPAKKAGQHCGRPDQQQIMAHLEEQESSIQGQCYAYHAAG